MGTVETNMLGAQIVEDGLSGSSGAGLKDAILEDLREVQTRARSTVKN